MLKPNHVCAWSHFRHTYLKFKDDRFQTGGTSLPVLRDALPPDIDSESKVNPSRVWFSRAYGDIHHGSHENLLLIAIDADSPEARTQKLQPYDDIGPVNKALLQGGFDRLDEYFLSEEIRTDLQISDEDSGYCLTEGSRIQQAIYLHDDCFGRVEPVNQTLLLRLLHSTLKLHSYYMEQEIDWSNVLQDLSRLLVEVEEFEIVSHPEANVLYVDWPHQIIRRSKNAPVKPYRAKMIINENKAQFELLDKAV